MKTHTLASLSSSTHTNADVVTTATTRPTLAFTGTLSMVNPTYIIATDPASTRKHSIVKPCSEVMTRRASTISSGSILFSSIQLAPITGMTTKLAPKVIRNGSFTPNAAIIAPAGTVANSPATVIPNHTNASTLGPCSGLSCKRSPYVASESRSARETSHDTAKSRSTTAEMGKCSFGTRASTSIATPPKTAKLKIYGVFL
mmetsp:Transcript_12849/g.30804  ORF Transcript_12849/g.30804 Transcript_12849/m.30804 type:complete len:201 (+) Transcript_12849:932-1534(+)